MIVQKQINVKQKKILSVNFSNFLVNTIRLTKNFAINIIKCNIIADTICSIRLEWKIGEN